MGGYGHGTARPGLRGRCTRRPNDRIDLRLAGRIAPMKMCETRELQNERALARLTRALPDNFPAPVLTYALNRRWTPPMPRLAVDGYWRAHPLRADRLTRVLARHSGAPQGWTWRLKESRRRDLPASF